MKFMNRERNLHDLFMKSDRPNFVEIVDAVHHELLTFGGTGDIGQRPNRFTLRASANVLYHLATGLNNGQRDLHLTLYKRVEQMLSDQRISVPGTLQVFIDEVPGLIDKHWYIRAESIVNAIIPTTSVHDVATPEHPIIQVPSGQSYRVVGDSVWIGRHRQNDIVFGHSNHISRLHAEIYREDGKWFIRDHCTASGTSVDGVSVRDSQKLRGNAAITIANDISFWFLQGDLTLGRVLPRKGN